MISCVVFFVPGNPLVLFLRQPSEMVVIGSTSDLIMLLENKFTTYQISTYQVVHMRRKSALPLSLMGASRLTIRVQVASGVGHYSHKYLYLRPSQDIRTSSAKKEGCFSPQRLASDHWTTRFYLTQHACGRERPQFLPYGLGEASSGNYM